MKKLSLLLVFACLVLFSLKSEVALSQPFTVHISALGDGDNIAGTEYGALDDYDPTYDQLDPSPTPVIYFPHPDWVYSYVDDSHNYIEASYDPLTDLQQWTAVSEVERDGTGHITLGGNFQHDIKAPYDPLTETKQWTFVVDVEIANSGGAAVRVNLDFDPSFDQTEGIVMRLHNRQSGQFIELVPPYTYGYNQYYPNLHTFDLIIGSQPTYNDLELIVDVFCSQLSDTGNRAGTQTGASDYYDPGLDIPEPGPSPTDYLVGSFFHPDWPMGPRFQSDVRPPFDPLSAKTWPFRVEVETDQTGSVSLDFSPNFNQAEYSLRLKDLTSGQSYDLYPSLSYSFEIESESIRDFEITIGGEPSPVPPLFPDFRRLEAGWSMVGFPLIPLPGQQYLGAVILDQAPGYAYSFLYEGDHGYTMQSAASSIMPGSGYWIATDTPFDWSMNGNRSLDPIEIALQNGWNLVSNPLWFPGPLENVLVKFQGYTYSWTDAVTQGLMSSGVMEFNTVKGDYTATSDLVAWNSYWFSALRDGITLTFDWSQFQKMPARFATHPVDDPAADLCWRTDFIATTSDSKTCLVTFGVSGEATSDFNPWLDLPLAPASPAGGVRMGILHPEWELSCGSRFASDYVQPALDSNTWNIELKNDQPGEIMLSWTKFDWPDGLDFQLYIPSQNRVVVTSMQEHDSVMLQVDSNSLIIEVRTPVAVSAVNDMPNQQYSMSVSPNPFNPQTTIMFNLGEPGDVEFGIFTMRGEKIRSLDALDLNAGQHEIVWRGRDQSGRSVPSGSYFLKMYRNGKPVGSVTKMSLIR